MFRVLVIIAAGLVAALSAPVTAQSKTQNSDAQFIQLDRHKIRYQAIGLENRRPGAPVIVLEAGLMSSLETWRSVLPGASALAPVIAYDRAGLGQSEWDQIPPTPEHATRRLRRLLRQIGAPPPYVLVGHSWGGVLSQYFAASHPGEVAGLVLLDPGPTLSDDPDGHLAPFRAIGADRTAYDAYWTGFAGLFKNAPPAARMEFATMRELLGTPPGERAMPRLAGIPIVVIVAGKYLHLPIYEQLPFDSRSFFAADLRHRLKVFQEMVLASPNGTLVAATSYTHALPREAPELVNWAIARMLSSARDQD